VSPFTHPQVVPSQYEFISSAENKIYFFGKNMVNQTVDGPH